MSKPTTIEFQTISLCYGKPPRSWVSTFSAEDLKAAEEMGEQMAKFTTFCGVLRLAGWQTPSATDGTRSDR